MPENKRIVEKMKFINSRLRDLYRRRPRWAVKLYYKLPLFVQQALQQKIVELEPPVKGEKVARLTLLPLDKAWAEVIIAPFHDPRISPTLPVEFEELNAHGSRLDFEWCWTVLSWQACSKQEDAAVLVLKADIEVHHFDTLILCLTLSKETTVRIDVRQDINGTKHETEYPGTGKRMEILVPLAKGIIREIKLNFRSDTELSQRVQLSWFGLQNSDLVRRMRENRLYPDSGWPGLVKPIEKWGNVHFEIGLLFGETDLEHLREKKKLDGWNDHFLLLEEKAKEYLKRQPENDMGDYLPFNDTRYLRERETGKTSYYFEALVLGFVGLVNQDKEMMFHALRYLMCMIHTRYWTQSGESRLPGSTWDQRCFLEEMTTSSVVLLADWFGFALTDRAKDLVRQSIWDKGLAVIERDLMKYEYLYHINQGAVFCRARVLGGLYLERFWPRLVNYTDRVFSDMQRCLKNYIAGDGGTHEGIGYFCQTLQATIPAAIAHSRSRNKSFGKFVKKYFSKCEDYVAVMSGSKSGTAIAEGDCRTDYFSGDAIPVLAGIFPNGNCGKILKSCLETGNVFAVTGTLTNSGGITGFVYGPDTIAAPEGISPTFAILKKSGHLASFRHDDNGQTVRLHITGSKSNPHHSHFDKGNMVLEFDSEPILIERGMVDYYYSEANVLKRSYMHNVITPVLEDGTFPDQNHPSKAVIPSGRGDNQSVYMNIDLTGVWEEYMSDCSRSIKSDNPNTLIIIDEGTLKEEGRIAFHLHSPYPFILEGETVKVRGQNHSITLIIKAPWADKILFREESINLKHKPVYHLMAHSPVLRKFVLNTSVERIS